MAGGVWGHTELHSTAGMFILKYITARAVGNKEIGHDLISYNKTVANHAVLYD